MDHVTSKSDASAVATELAERRTGMSFQRTRMSADRTLMSVIRTSLSLISFGFTIFQVFQKLREQNVLSGAAPARNFGVTLVLLGIVMLVWRRRHPQHGVQDWTARLIRASKGVLKWR